MIFRARQHTFTFPRPTLVMGVVNVTPDSFSDAGQCFSTEAAVAHALQLVAEGADILDIGGESTRPNAEPVPEAEELRRVIPVLQELRTRTTLPLSIDTQKPGVARAAVAAGASIINDIAANREDGAMWQIAAESEAGYIAMHMQGTPQTMQKGPVYQDVVPEVEAFFAGRLERLAAAGVARTQVVLDVGIGFGKTLEHNLQLLGGMKRFTRFERPLLLGVSRKSFMGKLLSLEVAERVPAALACTAWAVQAGVSLIRTHDVAATVQAVRMTEAILRHQT
jgi:dihydropteroate synthase